MVSSYLYLYLVASALAAFFSIAMWIDYFRKVDMFKPEKLTHLIFALIIGCITPFISIFLYRLIYKTGFDLNGNLLNDFLFTIFAVGVNEELCKVIGVIIVFRVFKKQIAEPIDYLIYAGVTALGFSIIENFKYFKEYGIQIIASRAFYSALVHIINTSIIVYGFYRKKLFNKGNQFQNTIIAFAIAAASHGMFDLFLVNDFLGEVTPFLSAIVYLIGINFWLQMLNNANNFSVFFDYTKIHHSNKLFFRLLYWYALVNTLAFIYNLIMFDVVKAFTYLAFSLFSDGLLLLIVILRASRFKIYKNKYFNVKIQMPFYFSKNDDADVNLFGFMPFKIRGENTHEYFLTKFIDKELTLYPIKKIKSILRNPKKIKIVDKFLLHDDVVVYLIRFINQKENTLFLLKPKTFGMKKINKQYPVVGLFNIIKKEGGSKNIFYKDLNLLEFVYIKV